jgi:hypothetical protein
MAYKVFSNGSVLNASDLNDFLMRQSVIVFSSSTSRASAITSPNEGMITYLEDTNVYQFWTGSAWTNLTSQAGVLQVVSSVKTDTFTTTGSTFVDVTGLSATITPSSATSKILVLADVKLAASDASVTFVGMKLLRGSTDVYIGDAAGSRTRVGFGGYVFGAGTTMGQASLNFLDSPATTSATTYKIQIAGNQGGGAGVSCVNRAWNDANDVGNPRGASSITLMEVAG